MGLSVKRSSYLRRLALFGGAVVAGSALPDLGRFVNDQGQSHNPLWPVLILAGVALTYSARPCTRFILKVVKK